MVISGPMLDGPQPRFPSSIAIKTPEDGRRAVDDLQKRGADFIKLQSLIPREAVFAIADEARKQGIIFCRPRAGFGACVRGFKRGAEKL